MGPTDETMKGKVCLVTGATSGIGAVAARELARRGAQVVLVGRNQAKCDAVVREIQTRTGSREVEALLADLSSREQVRDLAGRFCARHARLDVLVNNAGGIWMQRHETVDGFEMTFAVNHLAYFNLTLLLQGRLTAAVGSRVVNVSSRAHQRAKLDFNDLMGKRGYSGWRAYCRSKLANLLFTFEMARRFAGTGVTVNALHPGFVATGFAANNGWRGGLLSLAARLFGRTAEEGAKTIVYLATSPEVAGVSGGYFVNERPATPSAAARDEEAAKRLWQISLQLTGLAPGP